jgi:hypothetical protein
MLMILELAAAGNRAGRVLHCSGDAANRLEHAL